MNRAKVIECIWQVVKWRFYPKNKSLDRVKTPSELSVALYKRGIMWKI